MSSMSAIRTDCRRCWTLRSKASPFTKGHRAVTYARPRPSVYLVPLMFLPCQQYDIAALKPNERACTSRCQSLRCGQRGPSFVDGRTEEDWWHECFVFCPVVNELVQLRHTRTTRSLHCFQACCLSCGSRSCIVEIGVVKHHSASTSVSFQFVADVFCNTVCVCSFSLIF